MEGPPAVELLRGSDLWNSSLKTMREAFTSPTGSWARMRVPSKEGMSGRTCRAIITLIIMCYGSVGNLTCSLTRILCVEGCSFFRVSAPLTLGLAGYCHLNLLCFYCIALQKLKLCYLFSTVDLTLSVPGLTARFIIPPSPCRHDMPWNGFGLKPGKG